MTYTFDDNGNLLSEGVNTYVYDSANRLISVSGQSPVSSYQYNGLGDRLSQTVNGTTTNYTLDLNTGLTQVLNDGTSSYLYGNGRVSQTGSVAEYLVSTGSTYHLGDALGSVRQLTDARGEITLAKNYDPYGTVTLSSGNGTSPFAYTGEQQDASGLTYLRARYYASTDGRFLTRDLWDGDVKIPMSYNKWQYSYSNPLSYADPSGYCPEYSITSDGECEWTFYLVEFNGGFPAIEKVTIIVPNSWCNNQQDQPKEVLGKSLNSDKLKRQCQRIASDIGSALYSVKRRYNHWVADRLGRQDRNHRIQYQIAQDRLREALLKWDRHNCGNLPNSISDAREWFGKPLP